MSHNRDMPVADCFEERRPSISVSVPDVGLCTCDRLVRLDCQHIATRIDLKQVGVRS